MKIFGFVGWSGSGKTRLIVKLLPILIERGYTVSTIKHAHHNFDVDKPGKDSFEHRKAGASEVMIASEKRWALMREHRGAIEPNPVTLIAKMKPVDIILIEGFKKYKHPKLEVYRSHLAKPLLHPEDPDIIGIASDQALKATIKRLDIEDFHAIADFIENYCRRKQHVSPEVV
ncbi:MAG: molybdopterin-guanine dinucleotide biosynthesis protein B [Pseudomonadota bacterium]|nr:molybdopterin-guanine dinucleotide biosynthesis protein B [Pseudomonadota bacterium]